MKWPSWEDFKKGLRSFENELSRNQVKIAEDFEKFQERHPMLDQLIKDAIPFLPPPFNGIIDHVYKRFGENKVDASKEVLNYLHQVEQLGKSHYEIMSKQLSQMEIDMAKEETLIAVQDALISKIDVIDKKLDTLPSIEILLSSPMMDKEKSAYNIGIHSANFAAQSYKNMDDEEYYKLITRFIIRCKHIGIHLDEQQKTLLFQRTADSLIEFYITFNEEVNFGVDRYIITSISAGQMIVTLIILLNKSIESFISIKDPCNRIKDQMSIMIPNSPLQECMWRILAEIGQFSDLDKIPISEAKSLSDKIISINSEYMK